MGLNRIKEVLEEKGIKQTWMILPSFQPVINFLETVADDVLVNIYQKGKYKDVILPMVVIRRLDLLLEPTKERVLVTFEAYKAKLHNLDSLLTSPKHGSGLAFYNTSKFTLKKLMDDSKNLRSNFDQYLNGFWGNMQAAKDDLVINIMLAWNGSLGISPYNGITSPAYCVYRIKGNRNPEYFGYLFSTSLFKSEFRRHSTGIIDSRLRIISIFRRRFLTSYIKK